MGASVRLVVIMSASNKPGVDLEPSPAPGAPWIAGVDVAHFAPGETIELDPDIEAWPRPFSQAEPGSYYFTAVLDVDRSYTWASHRTEGDLQGPVVQSALPGPGGEVRLTLTSRVPARPENPEDKRYSLVELPSKLLGAFWGKPTTVRAVVATPPGYDADPTKRYPGVYYVHGFGGGPHHAAREHAPGALRAMADGKQAPKILVFLDGSFRTGHHEFADSANNGPWGRALTEELIPHLEKTLRLVAEPRARFVSGHSSGGWSALWLQITYPDFFGGAWATAPDPVDFQDFTGIDLTKPGGDMYRKPDGTPRPLMRVDGHEILGMEDLTRYEVALGSVGGQIASFEWVFSPKGPDGAPMKLFDRKTGAIDPRVEKAWEAYDIRRVLDRSWATLAPKLRKRLHLFVGTEDSFHLDAPTKLLCAFLAEKGGDADCHYIPGRTHFDLYEPHPSYPSGLFDRFLTEMQASYESNKP
jgi:Putative esterase